MTTTALELRWYQRECVDALFRWFAEQEGDALGVLPTGSGKSAVLSAFLAEARENYPPLRAIVLATRAELVRQNARSAGLFIPSTDIGIYSAGLGIKQTNRPVIVANIQSLVKRVFDLDAPDIVVVDEAQDIPDEQSGMYRKFFKAVRLQNPHCKIVGLTATPFKLSSGRLDQGPNALFAGVAYEAPVLRLIEEGYLCRPVTPRTSLTIDTSNVAVRGDFVAKDLAAAVDVDAITNAAADEIVEKFKDRHKWLIFACSVEHARHVAEALSARGVTAAVVHGELARDERDHRLTEFSAGNIRALVSVSILTVGYDEPSVDALALLRPTKSAGLYAQMIGRGMRVHPSKTDCLVLDFGKNIERFGPVDSLRVPEKKKGAARDQGAPAKLCPVCEVFQATSVRSCLNCGHDFPPPAIELSTSPSTAPILSSDHQTEVVEVTSVQYQKHEPRPPKTIPTLRVDYYRGYRRLASEWVCLEHDGFARSKAEQWWRARSPDNVPRTIDDALLLADDLLQPLTIELAPDLKDPKYQRIVGYQFTAPHDSGLPKACWTCTHWAARCTKWEAMPPESVQQTGCDDWTDDDPMPF